MRPYLHPTCGLAYAPEYRTQEAKSAKIQTSSREWIRPPPTCLPGQGGTAKAGCGLTGNQAGISPLDEGFFHGLVNHN